MKTKSMIMATLVLAISPVLAFAQQNTTPPVRTRTEPVHDRTPLVPSRTPTAPR
jgi:hypothetical protein